MQTDPPLPAPQAPVDASPRLPLPDDVIKAADSILALGVVCVRQPPETSPTPHFEIAVQFIGRTPGASVHATRWADEGRPWQVSLHLSPCGECLSGHGVSFAEAESKLRAEITSGGAYAQLEANYRARNATLARIAAEVAS